MNTQKSRLVMQGLVMLPMTFRMIQEKLVRLGLFDGGPFDVVLEKITALGRDAWGFGVGVLIVVGMLVGLFYVIQGVGGSVSGASGMTTKAILGAVGIVVAILTAFLLLPELGKMLQENKPEAPF